MPYTWGLLSSMPDVAADTDVRLQPIPGNPPSLLNPPSGCPFQPRCPHKDKVPGNLCETELPLLVQGTRTTRHTTRCHLPNPDAIYAAEVRPILAPDLVELAVADDEREHGHKPDGGVASDER
jgi:peptide/nickel transport system ATP-binding protein